MLVIQLNQRKKYKKRKYDIYLLAFQIATTKNQSIKQTQLLQKQISQVLSWLEDYPRNICFHFELYNLLFVYLLLGQSLFVPYILPIPLVGG